MTKPYVIETAHVFWGHKLNIVSARADVLYFEVFKYHTVAIYKHRIYRCLKILNYRKIDIQICFDKYRYPDISIFSPPHTTATSPTRRTCGIALPVSTGAQHRRLYCCVFGGFCDTPLIRFPMVDISPQVVGTAVLVRKRSAVETSRRELPEDVSLGIGTLLVVEQSSFEKTAPRGG